jgi:hypothetical protein
MLLMMIEGSLPSGLRSAYAAMIKRQYSIIDSGPGPPMIPIVFMLP